MTPSSHPRASLKHPDFRLYLTARFMALAAHQMMAVGVAQYVYQITHNPLHLGYIGLAIFIPKFALTLPAGHVADRFNRKRVVFWSRLVEFLGVLGIFLYALFELQALPLLYGLLFLVGCGYAFDGPANQAVVTQLVPPEDFGNAVTWNSSVMQIAFIVGPALAGWFYILWDKALAVFLTIVILRLASTVLILGIKAKTEALETSQTSWHTAMAGIRYVFNTKIILGVISLDLFAVLFGGAVALLPVYANDILHVGAQGLGWLRTAPSLGAALMAITIAHRPPMKKAGMSLFGCVALFGLCTIFFGLSKNFILSMILLVILGASDMVSVVIRNIIVQTKTPPHMRGRVSAVNLIFIGASNELGEFESGLTAAWFGTIPAVVLGGVGTLAVVGLWMWKFPEIRKLKNLIS